MTSASQSPPRRYRFADLTLDAGQRRLWRGDDQIELSKLTFDFLLTLVEAAPNLLTHDQLAEGVWGQSRVVTPENLSQRLKMLRGALGEQADHRSGMGGSAPATGCLRVFGSNAKIQKRLNWDGSPDRPIEPSFTRLSTSADGFG